MAPPRLLTAGARRLRPRGLVAGLAVLLLATPGSVPAALGADEPGMGGGLDVLDREGAGAAPSLAAGIDQVLADPALTSATVGVHVVDLEKGRALYARNADTALNPASNTKLATTAAALLLLGPEYRYPTLLLHEPDALQGSVLKGDLYIRGSGDPELVTEDLYVLVSELHARGVRRVSGGVVVDSTRFDRDELPPGFDQKEELAAYRAPSGATSINFNTFVVRVQAADAPGGPALAALDPPVRGIEIVNETKTVKGHRRRLFAEVLTDDDVTTLRLWGDIGVDAGAAAYRYPVVDPARHAGDVLVTLLRQRGIRVGRTKVRLKPSPPDAEVVARHYSQPLSILIRAINKFSNNFMAEQVLKSLAPPDAPATFEAALEQVRAQLRLLGIDLRGARLGNGSGLYDNNRLTTRQITGILAAMYGDFRYRADYLASMAVIGVDGTTRSRLREATAQRWARGKTGTLDGISALSGYVGGPGGKVLAYSVIFNDLPPGASRTARKAQDDITELLARYASGQPLTLAATP